MHFHTTAALGLVAMLLGSPATAADHPPVPGSYRPTTDSQIQAGPGNHQQFIPYTNSNPRYPSAPTQQPGYAPPNYWNNNTPPPNTSPGFSVNPGRMMNDMFNGGSSNLPYGYPAMAAPARVAPIYDPPIPGGTPGWGYGVQPATPAYAPQPASQAYNTPSSLPSANSQAPAAGAYNAAGDVNPAIPATTTPPPLEPTPSGQGRGQAVAGPTRPAPRPFSNPQETGNAFVQRGNTALRTTYGGNDSRFRPPELKGTP